MIRGIAKDMTKTAFVGILTGSYEDSGMAWVGDGIGNEGGMFVKLQSWDETAVAPRGSDLSIVGKHNTIKRFIGGRVLITVELLDQ